MGLKHISHRRQQYATPTYPSPETYLLRTMLFLLPSKDFRPFTFCSGFDGQNQNLITGRSNFMAQYCCSLPSPPSNDQKNSHTNGPNLIIKVKMMVFHQGGQCEAVSSPAEEGCDHQLTLQMGEATPKQCLGRYKGPLYLSSPIICFIAIKKSPLLCSVHGHGRLLASREGWAAREMSQAVFVIPVWQAAIFVFLLFGRKWTSASPSLSHHPIRLFS